MLYLYAKNFCKTQLPIGKIGGKSIIKIIAYIEAILPESRFRFDKVAVVVGVILSGSDWDCSSENKGKN